MSLNVLEEVWSTTQTLSWVDRVPLVSGDPLLTRTNLFAAGEKQTNVMLRPLTLSAMK